MVRKTENAQSIEEQKFTKEQLIASRKYANRRDTLNALLKDGETYSHQDVEQILEKFYKGGSK